MHTTLGKWDRLNSNLILNVVTEKRVSNWNDPESVLKLRLNTTTTTTKRISRILWRKWTNFWLFLWELKSYFTKQTDKEKFSCNLEYVWRNSKKNRKRCKDCEIAITSERDYLLFFIVFKKYWHENTRLDKSVKTVMRCGIYQLWITFKNLLQFGIWVILVINHVDCVIRHGQMQSYQVLLLVQNFFQRVKLG